MDRILQVLLLSDHHNIHHLVNFIQANPDVQPYVYSKLTQTLTPGTPHLARQQSLAQLYGYVVGEYFLQHGQSDLESLVSTYQTLLTKATSQTTLYLVYGLAKLYAKGSAQKNRILAAIRTGATSPHLEIQSRCLETAHLLESSDWQPHQKFLFDSMPAYAPKDALPLLKVVDKEDDLLDIDDFLNEKPPPTQPVENANAKYDILDSIFNDITTENEK